MLPQSTINRQRQRIAQRGKRSAGKKRRNATPQGSNGFMRWVSKVTQSEPIMQRLREGGLIVLSAIALFLLLALSTHSILDPGWSHSGSTEVVANVTGPTGAWFADVLYSLFGLVAFLFPVSVFYLGILIHRGADSPAMSAKRQWHLWALRFTGMVLSILSSCTLAAMHWHVQHELPLGSGGYLGSAIAHAMTQSMNPVGATVLLVAFFLTGITFASGLSWLRVLDHIGQSVMRFSRWLRESDKEWLFSAIERLRRAPKTELPRLMPPKNKEPKIVRMNKPKKEEKEAKTPILKKALSPRGNKETPKVMPMPAHPISKGAIEAPSLGLLDTVEEDAQLGYSEEELKALSALVEQRLLEFGIETEVVAVHPGPVITRFELSLAPGIKVSRITSLAKDLARALSVISVRVVEVIPGKPYIGLEIPNADREIVRLKAILAHGTYQKSHSPLTLALGKDISGRPQIADLGKMPHLLVAGTTGSGKSVALNAMLLSILYKASPKEVRLILIDPKMLELAVYDNIPHLLTPVVTDMKEASNALRWCVNEMERRYQLMAALGVRQLASFNRKVQDAIDNGKPILDPLWVPNPLDEEEEPPHLETLPYIVVLVDEFADLMMVVGKKVEELIARIAQKARAAGIHLILATQRPSVDVITGLIKANIPTRIAFQVSSKVDSRTILDQMGAEQLLGHGDMLYLPPGAGIPTRIHGAFVADDEVHKVTEELRSQSAPDYIEAIVTTQHIATPGQSDDEESDELYDEALFIVTESRRASISNLQRRLKIGYNRAARLIERMEMEGVVSPVQPNGSREVIAPPPVENG